MNLATAGSCTRDQNPRRGQKIGSCREIESGALSMCRGGMMMTIDGLDIQEWFAFSSCKVYFLGQTRTGSTEVGDR